MGRKVLLACVLIICIFQFSSAQDLLEVAAQQNLTTLITAIEWKNLTSVFKQPEANLTLFGPTDAALSTFSYNITIWNETEALTDVLKYHTLSKVYRAENLTNGLVIEETLLPGGWIRVNHYNGSIFLNGVARIGVADINATNGELHILNDTILIPPTINTDMNKTLAELLSEKFLSLYAALNSTELYRLFGSPDFNSTTYTFFAPTQDAFDKVPPYILANLFHASNNDTLMNLLKYHVVQGIYFSPAFTVSVETPLTTLNGENINVTVNFAGNFTVNNANVTTRDVQVRNGVIHSIDELLIPANFQFPANYIVDTMFEEGLFIMINALGWQGLTPVFTNLNNNHTVFVPLDSAFENFEGLQSLNASGELAEYLKFHAVPGNVLASSLSNEYIINNTLALGSSYLRVNFYRGEAYLNGYAKIVKTNIPADNGVVHIIDSVLVPNGNTTANLSIAQLLTTNSNFSTLLAALNAANLTDLFTSLEYNPSYTVFAPTNAAFEGLPINLLNVLLNAPDLLKQVLQYHVISGTLFSSAFPGPFLTSEGSNVTVSLYGNELFVNDAKITSRNNQVRNGVVHIIDSVILPPNLKLPENATNLLDVAYVHGLTDLVQYVKWQNLELELSVNETIANYTIFAPTNAAFEQVPNINNLNTTGQLLDILKYHVVKGRVFQSNLTQSVTLNNTLADYWLRVNVYTTGIFLNGVHQIISQNDTIASNGVIHVIDSVLVSEPSNQTLVEAIGNNYAILHSAIVANPALNDLLSDPDFNKTHTLFAPSDNAFNSLPKGFLDVLKLPENEAILSKILSTHVLFSDYYTTAFNGSQLILNAAGTFLNITGNQLAIAVNGTIVTTPNQQTRNGVFHGIGKIILPEGLPAPYQSNIIDYLFVVGSDLYNIFELEQLTPIFQGTDNFTLFVPTNDALSKLNVTNLNTTGEFKNILLYHALAGNLNSSQLQNDEAYVTANTDPEAYLRVNVYPSGVYLNGLTKVTKANLNVSNGILHEIDSVLFPPNATNGHNLTIVEALVADSRFTNLTAALTLAGLVDAFKNDSLNPDNQYTVFAPTDAAFQALPTGILDALLKPQNLDLLKNILTFHVLKRGFFTPYYANGQTSQRTLADTNVTVSRDGNTITVGSGAATVTQANKQYRNGVVHVIDKVLLSPAYTNTTIGLLESKGLTSFLQVLNRLNLTQTFLTRDQPSTLFVPTNDAFSRVDINAITEETLYYHILNGRFEANQIVNDQVLLTQSNATNNGIRTSVYTAGIYLNGYSKVIAANQEGSNVTVHQVDTVLSIPNANQSLTFQAYINADPNYSLLLKAIQQTNLLSAFPQYSPDAYYPALTYFVPTNSAFDKLGTNKDFLFKSENNQTLFNVLLYHIAQGVWFTPAFTDLGVNSSYSMGGQNVHLNLTGPTYAVNGIKVVVENRLIKNGVVQGIDQVLLPPGVNLPVDNNAIIIGASVGGGIGLILLIILIVVCVRRNKKGDYEAIRS